MTVCIIAIRYMEVNSYLPTKTRVLSSETEGKIEHNILTNALNWLKLHSRRKRINFQVVTFYIQ